MKAVLTIAGSDSSGGAGIQADLKTIAAHGLYGESVITALTAQNTTGVFGVENVAPEFVARQIDVVFDDIRPDAVKIGMVSSPEIAKAIAEALVRNKAENVVVDPVMVATSGSALIANEAVSALVEHLFPLAAVVTPNVPEAQVLAGFGIKTAADAERAAEVIARACLGAVLIKGGHGLAAAERKVGRDARSTGASECADDALECTGGVAERAAQGCAQLAGVDGSADGMPRNADAAGGHADDVLRNRDAARHADDVLRRSDGTVEWFLGRRIDTRNTHGTGCTLSSALACGLACGFGVSDAVRRAKEYVAGALAAGLDLGRGSGPLDHMWNYR